VAFFFIFNKFKSFYLMIRFFLFICCSFLFLSNYSQASNNDARMVTIIGSQENFNFNTIARYDGGITKLRRTRLGLDFSNDAVAYTNWQLTVELQQIGLGATQSTIDSDDPLSSLSINTIELKAEDANGNLVGAFSDWQVLAHGIVLLTSSTIPANATNHQVDISYRCGVTHSVFGSSSDYYEIDLDFVISPVP
jgi:hypothetical protein